MRFIASLVMLVAVGAIAWAQAPNPAADASLRKGRALMRAGKFHEACDAFEESQRLEPQLATLFTLGACQEKVGKITSAWLAYREVASHDTNKDRRRKANELATRLASRVPKLLVQIDHELLGLSVTLSGKNITDRIGLDLPVDPGSYTIVAIATGFKEATRDVKVAADGKVTSVQLTLEPETKTNPEPTHTDPPLVDHDPPIVDKPPPIDKLPPPTPAVSHRKTYAALLAAAGGVGLAVSIGVGVAAHTKWAQAKELCMGTVTCPDQATLDLANARADQAAARGNIATVVGIASGVAIAGGVLLWLTAPHDAISISPSASANSAGVLVSGSF